MTDSNEAFPAAAPHPLVAEKKLMVVPGVFDVLSAKVADAVGFPSAVLTGYGVSAAHLGEPDFGILTQTQVLDVARRVVAATELGLIVDGDTGYGGPVNVQHMVRELVAMGARGIILEDQRWPKRCGHMRGKAVIDAEEHVAKIEAAVEARCDRAFFITARTDALETHGIDEAIRRAKLYKEAGATVLFVEGPRSLEDLRRIGNELPPPLALNLIEGGLTPMPSLEEVAELGFFSVGFVLSGLYAATQALFDTYTAIREHGTTDGVRDRMTEFEAFNRFIGADERYAEDERFKR
jgi:methylisocitrate lyase